MIHFFAPFDAGMNLGKAYNKAVELIPDEDWVCITDGDTMFPYPDYGSFLQRIINRNPRYDLLTCYTNRVGDRRQCWRGVCSEETDLVTLYQTAKQVRRKGSLNVRRIAAPFSGMLMLFSKRVWHEVKFNESGILGVDNLFTSQVAKAGFRIGIMKGFYVIHYYRLELGEHNKLHLK